MRVFTLGTDHRKQFEFTRILWKYGVQVVFDIRRVPESQEDYFRRDGLQALCASQGMDYVYLGNELGGPVHGDQRGWTQSDEFRRGLDILRKKAPKRVCCLLCAERAPERCHRLIIAEHLIQSGIEIVHILDENQVWKAPEVRRPDSAPRRPR